jgi:phosphatidylglycerophosphate synthase
MLDPITTKWIKPPLKIAADKLNKIGITPNQITVFGFLVGISAIPALYLREYYVALGLIVINRILDGLDGALARETRPTDAGGFLDITLDFIFYSGIIFGFALADPQTNALAAAALIFAFIGTASSFLAFAVMATKNSIESVVYPNKSLYYLGGLTEGTETIILFVLICLFPRYFPLMAYVFAGACWLTTILRIVAGYTTLKKMLN